MLRNTKVKLLSLLAIFFVATPAQAQDDPEKLLVDISVEVLQAVKENQDTYGTTPEVLQSELLALLDPIVDFEAFARGVMGNYYGQATAEQRAEFENAFKATLVELYTSALVAANVTEIEIEQTTMRPPNGARVVMNVLSATNGNFVLQYTLRRNDAGEWKVRNIIIDGVNIGLTYRNQFKSAMETENQDLARVITLWPEIIDGQ